ncbi:MAG TPA: protein-disulfide reductase DsbD domain-containing protein [Pyrinomonadaceae bacterium]|nr:protein-disulfide reductase DsbD domain-containing protein [Pyrinomonadaceae bacterium]
MRQNAFTRRTTLLLFFAILLAPARFTSSAAPKPLSPAQEGDIQINGFFSVDPAQQGSSFQAAIVMEIPRGLHVNGNRPLGKFAIPTTVKVDAPRGMKISAVTYPRAQVRSFRFGEGVPAERLAVYEGRSIVRFNVTVPPNFERGVARIRVNVRYQSCSDTVCYPPRSEQLTLPIAIVDPGHPFNRINGQYFGGGGRGKRR